MASENKRQKTARQMATFDDISLVTQVVIFHRKKAFDRLVVKYQGPIRRFFLTQTHGNEALSDDLAQDTFLKAYTHLTQFRASSKFSTWLYSIAYRVFLDHVRAEKTRFSSAESPSQQSEAIPLGGSGGASSSLSLDLHTALAILNENERTCITLQLIDGFSTADIATVTCLNEGTVRANLSRGKKKLANYLKQNGYDGK